MCFVLSRVVLCCVVSCHVMSALRCVVPYRVMSCRRHRVTSCHVGVIVSRHVMSALRCVVLCCIVLCRIVSRDVMSALRCVVLYCVVPYRVMSCHVGVTLCYVVSWIMFFRTRTAGPDISGTRHGTERCPLHHRSWSCWCQRPTCYFLSARWDWATLWCFWWLWLGTDDNWIHHELLVEVAVETVFVPCMEYNLAITMKEWMNNKSYIAPKKQKQIAHKNPYVHSARCTQCIPVGSHMLKLSKTFIPIKYTTLPPFTSTLPRKSTIT